MGASWLGEITKKKEKNFGGEKLGPAGPLTTYHTPLTYFPVEGGGV